MRPYITLIIASVLSLLFAVITACTPTATYYGVSFDYGPSWGYYHHHYHHHRPPHYRPPHHRPPHRPPSRPPSRPPRPTPLPSRK